jgi:hypothetical protein
MQQEPLLHKKLKDTECELIRNTSSGRFYQAGKGNYHKTAESFSTKTYVQKRNMGKD